MRSTRLGNQVLLLSVTLVCTVSLAILSSVWISTAAYTREQVGQDTDRAVKVFNRVLEERRAHLTSAAEVLTADFGFRQAVATDDRATIESALQNHAARINADLMSLLDLQGVLQAVYGADPIAAGSRFRPLGLLERALKNSGAASFVSLGGEFYQIIVVPVRSPLPVAFAAVGFRLDAALAAQLLEMTNLNVSFVDDGEAAERNTIISTLDPARRESALRAPAVIRADMRMPWASQQHFLSHKEILASYEGHRIEAVLTVDLDQAFRDFDRLRDTILVITFAIIIVAVLASVLMTRNLAGPLRQLEGVARRIAVGDYRRLSGIHSSTLEIRSLFDAFVAMRKDIREREEHIRYQATHDPLTDLLNRSTLLPEVDEQLPAAEHRIVVLAINVDRFRNINDTFGPRIGDRFLAALAQRLVSVESSVSLAARSGGDEFFLVLAVPHGAAVETWCAQVRGFLSRPVELDNLELRFSLSIGAALFPADGRSAEILIRRAGIALDHTRGGAKEVRFYCPGEEEAHLEHLKLFDDLHSALEQRDGQLQMYYQPKLDLRSGRVEKCEALIRWEHPGRGFVPPDEFVELAERSGLIHALTEWVIGEVVRQAALWRSTGLPMQIAINVSAADLERPGLLEYVECQLESHALDAEAISFELTERDMMSDAALATERMREFAGRGFEFAIDDYGIGQSSLSVLRHMPVGAIKIDKSFVTHLDTSENDRIIVRSTIELCHSFNLRVVAEGVESVESVKLLREMGCDRIQGYYLARPMPAALFVSWLQQWRAKKPVRSLA